MEYSELISKILTAEHNAQEISKEAKKKQEFLDADLEKEAQQLHETYLERARKRLVQVEQQEDAAAASAVAKLDQKQANAMATLEDTLAKNENQWVESLFHMIVGDVK